MKQGRLKKKNTQLHSIEKMFMFVLDRQILIYFIYVHCSFENIFKVTYINMQCKKIKRNG